MKYGVIILAGGGGQRIGRKKPFIKINNQPMISLITNLVHSLTDEIIVVINGDDRSNPIIQGLPSDTIIVEDLERSIGPLIGIYSGMKKSSSEYSLVLPCDSPFLNLDLLNFLLTNARTYDAVIPRWPNGFIEPLHSVYHVPSSIEAIENSIVKGEKRIQDFIKRLKKVKYIEINDLRKFDKNLLTFFNINYFEDLEKANLHLN